MERPWSSPKTRLFRWGFTSPQQGVASLETEQGP